MSHAANRIGLTPSTNESTMDGFLTSAYHSYGSKPANHTRSSISLSNLPPAGEQPPSSSSYAYYPQQQHQPPTHHHLESTTASPDPTARSIDQISQENALDEEPLYVNAKQYYRILKRRVARARLEEVHRLSKQRKVHLPPSPSPPSSATDSYKAVSPRIAPPARNEAAPWPWRSFFNRGRDRCPKGERHGRRIPRRRRRVVRNSDFLKRTGRFCGPIVRGCPPYASGPGSGTGSGPSSGPGPGSGSSPAFVYPNPDRSISGTPSPSPAHPDTIRSANAFRFPGRFRYARLPVTLPPCNTTFRCSGLSPSSIIPLPCQPSEHRHPTQATLPATVASESSAATIPTSTKRRAGHQP